MFEDFRQMEQDSLNLQKVKDGMPRSGLKIQEEKLD